MANGFKFEDNSRKIKNQMNQVSEAAIESALLLIEGQAKALAPVGTGELRDKIDHRIFQRDGNIIGQVGSPLDYSIYVEYGTGEHAENGAGRKGGWRYRAPDGTWHFTRGMKPQPFLRPAFRQNKRNIQEIIGKEYGASFDRK